MSDLEASLIENKHDHQDIVESDEDDEEDVYLPPDYSDQSQGEIQPTSCRDWPFAIAFLIQLTAMMVVGSMYGVPILKEAAEIKVASKEEEDSIEENYKGVLNLAGIALGVSFLLTFFMVGIMVFHPKRTVQASVIFSVVQTFLFMIMGILSGSWVAGSLGFVFVGLTVCYAKFIWSHLRFASANLNTALTAVKKNLGIVIVVLLIEIVSVAYIVFWTLSFIGVIGSSQTSVVAEVSTTDDGSDSEYEGPNGGLIFLLLLSLYWTQQVFMNLITVVVSGVVSTWWFAPEEASSCCSLGVRTSFVRASVYSFGSICFGSLLVAIIQVLKSLAQRARHDDNRNNRCQQVLYCCLQCLLQMLEGVLGFFNKWAFVYVGMYGYSYLEAGKKVMDLFRARGMETLITDGIIMRTPTLVVFTVSMGVGGIGMLIDHYNPEYLAVFEDNGQSIAFFICALVALVVSSIMMSIVGASVNTVMVCLAEAPADFMENHPNLATEMISAWQDAYPGVLSL